MNELLNGKRLGCDYKINRSETLGCRTLCSKNNVYLDEA